jgi:rhodanese-related sulfurtransferase
VLTGDALFIGDVGRPDLLGATMPASELAGMLYDSLHHKLLTLPDTVQVFPAHGAGSLCGRNISSEKSSTIGHERRFNYALQPMSREAFVTMMTTDLPEPPSYFSRDARINLEGPALLEQLPPPQPLTPAELKRRQADGALVLDTRPSQQYGNGHIAGALNVGLGGQFASSAGALLPPEVPIVIVAEDDNHVREAQLRLARVGLENVAGYLAGGILAWHEAGFPLAVTEQISIEELRRRLEDKSLDVLIDVRRPAEWSAGHIAQAVHHPLQHLKDSSEMLNRNASTAVVCAGGYRSSIASSILERAGFVRICNVVGGMSAWNTAGLPVS